jgi:hypothetical protein
MAYCLRHVGVITMIGKHGNAIVYARTGDLTPQRHP